MTVQKCTEDQNTSKFHPHCMLVMHELEGPDMEEWIHYCRWFTHFIHWDMAISDKVNVTDKVGLYLIRYIQGVSRLYGITAGGDFLSLCDQKSSYKLVSDFGRLRSYDRLKLRIEGNDY